MTDASLAALHEGYRSFRKEIYARNEPLFRTLADAQAPKALVIACCDSRVDPTMILGAAPGELFMVRNIANLVPPFEEQRTRHGTSAALEFAVTVLEVPHIIVMGHAQCGGIRALMMGTDELGVGNDFIKDWMAIAEPARERALAALPGRPLKEQADCCEREGIKVSLENLKTFPCIGPRLSEARLALHGWHFDIGDGRLSAYDPATDLFEPIPS